MPKPSVSSPVGKTACGPKATVSGKFSPSLNKIYLFISFGYSTILTALWPVMAEAAVMDDPAAISKVNKMLLRNIFIGMGYILLATLVILTMKKFVIGFFAGAQLMVSSLIIILFGTRTSGALRLK